MNKKSYIIRQMLLGAYSLVLITNAILFTLDKKTPIDFVIAFWIAAILPLVPLCINIWEYRTRKKYYDMKRQAPKPKRIKYHVNGKGRLITKCPYCITLPDIPFKIYVGSHYCEKCQYFVSDDIRNEIVECNYENEKPKVYAVKCDVMGFGSGWLSLGYLPECEYNFKRGDRVRVLIIKEE